MCNSTLKKLRQKDCEFGTIYPGLHSESLSQNSATRIALDPGIEEEFEGGIAA